MDNLDNYIVIDRTLYSQRKKHIKVSCKKLNELFDIFIKVYLKRYKDIDEKFLRIVGYKSLQPISDLLFFCRFLNLKKKIEVVEIPYSSNDLNNLLCKGKLIDNVNYLLNINKTDFIFNNKIIDHGIYDGLNKKNKLNPIIKIFLKLVELIPLKKKVLVDIINIDYYLKFIKKGYKPIFYDKSYFEKKINSSFNKKLRQDFYKDAIEIFLLNKNDYKNINLNELNVLFALLPINIVENFEELKKENTSVKKYNFFDRMILSEVSGLNDNANFWLANYLFKVKTKLEIYQHGSGYFWEYYNPIVPHETEVADKFYSWTKKKSQKFKQYPVTRYFSKSIKKKYDLLLVNGNWPYFYKSHSSQLGLYVDRQNVEASKFLKYINYTKNYIIKRPTNIFTSNYYAPFDEEDINKRFTNENLKYLVPQSKICVCSYFGTVFFEFMANDIPFIVFSKRSHSILTEDANVYLKKLKKFGFLFYSAHSAAKFLNENHDNILELWNDKEFKNFRADFRDKFTPKKIRDKFGKKKQSWQEILINE